MEMHGAVDDQLSDEAAEAYGYPPRPPVDRLINSSTDIRITVFELYDMVYLLKMSDSMIAKKYEISTRTVRNYRKKCQFDATFRAGTMDLPLHLVRTMVQEGKNYEQIAVEFNTTKTSVKSFCDRHGIRVDDTWPIDRIQMLDLILKEFTNVEIASQFSVEVKDVELLQASLGLHGFSGTKTHEVVVVEPRVESSPFDGLTVGEKFLLFFPEVASYDKRFGYSVSGTRVPVNVVIEIVANYERSDEFQELVIEHSAKGL